MSEKEESFSGATIEGGVIRAGNPRIRKFVAPTEDELRHYRMECLRLVKDRGIHMRHYADSLLKYVLNGEVPEAEPRPNVRHHGINAYRELMLLGWESKKAEAVADVIGAFVAHGLTVDDFDNLIPVIQKILGGEPLSPLTNDPDEWWKVTDELDIWVNARRRSAISEDGGNSYYLADDPIKHIYESKRVDGKTVKRDVDE